MANLASVEHNLTTDGHTTHYLACGPVDGTPIIFVHGWPELSLSWRHQLPVFGGLGFRAIAPDLRGYGGSSVYDRHEDYALEKVVADMLALLDSLEVKQAIWVGHDWGSPVVWSIASHHPERCLGVANLCVPYRTLDLGLDHTLTLVNRDIYPVETFPAGQWEYMRFYEEQFDKARRTFEANPYNTAKLLFRKGSPAGFGQPAGTAFTRINNGWFGTDEAVPDLPRDDDVVTEDDLQVYAEGLARNGFFGPDSYYMNHERNGLYGTQAVNNGELDMPVLFLAAQYDYTCDAINSDLAVPMRSACSRLTERVIYSGHWMAQEQPTEVSSAIATWLATELPGSWRQSRLA